MDLGDPKASGHQLTLVGEYSEYLESTLVQVSINSSIAKLLSGQ